MLYPRGAEQSLHAAKLVTLLAINILLACWRPWKGEVRQQISIFSDSANRHCVAIL